MSYILCPSPGDQCVFDSFITRHGMVYITAQLWRGSGVTEQRHEEGEKREGGTTTIN